MNRANTIFTYDLQEPFRFIFDLAVMNLIEKGVMDNKDFVRIESFSLRLRPTGARKVTEEFNSVMNERSSSGKGIISGDLYCCSRQGSLEECF